MKKRLRNRKSQINQTNRMKIEAEKNHKRFLLYIEWKFDAYEIVDINHCYSFIQPPFLLHTHTLYVE